jgi:dihydroorotate dehydrogenase (fumarate)
MTTPSATEPAPGGRAVGGEAVGVDLTTSYLGLELANPVVAAASPMTNTLDNLAALQEAGVSAVVLPSLFEEQVEHDHLAVDDSLSYGSELNVESHGGFFPDLDDYKIGATEYLDLLKSAKDELAVPVIASLNGSSDGGWTHYAATLQEEGADALELNVYHVAADPEMSSTQVEDRYLRLVEAVRAEVDIPLAVKIGPFFSSPANMARRLVAAGADGLVLFNRFYQPDIDLDTLTVKPDLVLSTPAEMRLVLRWMAILHGRVDTSLAATTGVHDAAGATKLILAGADVAMMASALLARGFEQVGTVVDGMRDWLTDNEYSSVAQARGSMSQVNVADPDSFERANYMKTLISYTPS